MTRLEKALLAFCLIQSVLLFVWVANESGKVADHKATIHWMESERKLLKDEIDRIENLLPRVRDAVVNLTEATNLSREMIKTGLDKPQNSISNREKN